MAQKRGPRLRGQRLLDNAPCQAAVNLGSSALLFPRHRALLVQHRPDRHAKGSPSGRAGERSETERASPGQKRLHAAISRFFVRAILSLCFYISVSILALSVIASQCHLSQRERLWHSAVFPVSFFRSLWYTYFAALPAHFIIAIFKIKAHIRRRGTSQTPSILP